MREFLKCAIIIILLVMLVLEFIICYQLLSNNYTSD